MTTTASSTPCWRGRLRLRSKIERAFRGVLAACILLSAGGTALAESVPAEVTQLVAERSDEGVLLTANVKFDLPQVVEDALMKGIPMYFVADALLFRDRWYWYDKQVSSSARHMRLSYQPLTRRWRLVVSIGPISSSGLSLGQTFETQEEALAGVQHISHWKIAELADIDPDERYNVQFRFRLDVSQLPRPFQIGAMGHSDWSITASRSTRLNGETAR